jgi:hypothetical protein
VLSLHATDSRWHCYTSVDDTHSAICRCCQRHSLLSMSDWCQLYINCWIKVWFTGRTRNNKISERSMLMLVSEAAVTMVLWLLEVGQCQMMAFSLLLFIGFFLPSPCVDWTTSREAYPSVSSRINRCHWDTTEMNHVQVPGKQRITNTSSWVPFVSRFASRTVKLHILAVSNLCACVTTPWVFRTGGEGGGECMDRAAPPPPRPHL